MTRFEQESTDIKEAKQEKESMIRDFFFETNDPRFWKHLVIVAIATQPESIHGNLHLLNI
jgi:hypothetical protein